MREAAVASLPRAAANSLGEAVPVASAPAVRTTAEPADGKVPAFKPDRRCVTRKPSDRPLFSEVAEEHFAEREAASGAGLIAINACSAAACDE
jgi:hypothetical protein